MQEPHSHLPYGADGSGFYSDNTIGCFNVVAAATPMMVQCIQSILDSYSKQENPKVFVMADYGAADGGTSMPLFYTCVKRIKEICGKEQNIHIMYEDQPTNDFKSLFLRLNGKYPF